MSRNVSLPNILSYFRQLLVSKVYGKILYLKLSCAPTRKKDNFFFKHALLSGKVTQILTFDLKVELTTQMVVLFCDGEVQQKD